MEIPHPRTYLKRERRQTDESLTAERGKTDESLSNVRKKSERHTDSTVKHDRKQADQARDKIRADTDIDIQQIREKRSDDAGQTRRLEHQTDTRLSEQRQSNDDAVQMERSRMDTAIQAERAATDAVFTKSLTKERGQTDENLSCERKKTDSEAQRSSQLLTKEQASHCVTKAALTTRDEFLAIVSHDLRNPIGTVLAYADLLSKDPSFADRSDKAKDWIEVIRRNAATALRLITDILDMERFAEGKLLLQFVEQNVEALLQNAVANFTTVALKNKILLQALPPNAPLVVSCDRERIAQVLSNLIGNALKFTPEGGSITVRAQQANNEILVQVTDTGPGIPDSEKNRVFDRYAQLHDKDRSGLGLGLYISKMLIEAHQGQLWVCSSIGAGSTFSFTLPLPR